MRGKTSLTRGLSRNMMILGAGLLSLTGCVRMAVMPTADPEIDMEIAVPRPTDQIDVPLEKDRTKLYRVGANDVLQIAVAKDPAIKGLYNVNGEGQVLIPYIGPVAVADLTVKEIESKLNTELATYINNPEAIVGVSEHRSKVVWVVGQVNSPGPITMRADMMTVQEAVFAAGLFTTDAAIKRTRVITPDYDHPIVREINLTDVLLRGKMRENMLLQPNDVVFVPDRYSTHLTSAIRELLAPIQDVADFNARLEAGGFGNDDNNN